jgi:2-C-methyl-D-erythritol 4-phosphate cytidylyltransferase/2-C-methyl-D-erythritol 2,4-cyclodiphosphate synthase
VEAWCIVVAGGSGSRFGGLKQFESIDGITVLEQSVRVARMHVAKVVAVVPTGYEGTPGRFGADLVVPGGATRSDSVKAGLAVVGENASHVLVHDGARPFVTGDVFLRVLAALADGARAVIPVLDVTDTVKEIEGDHIVRTLDRNKLAIVQTPQGFTRDALAAMYALGRVESDDAALAELIGIPVLCVAGDAGNVKITRPSDRLLLNAGAHRSSLVDTVAQEIVRTIRVGFGFDAHRFSDDPRRKLVLCGVEFDGLGLEGHSDADVGCHAVADALLGAAGEGGIGDHFPASDMALSGANSLQLLGACRDKVEAKGFVLVNTDLTLICETPVLAPRRMEMERRLSNVLGSSVCVKGKRTEGLGSIGRREGIAAVASVTIMKRG